MWKSVLLFRKTLMLYDGKFHYKICSRSHFVLSLTAASILFGSGKESRRIILLINWIFTEWQVNNLKCFCQSVNRWFSLRFLFFIKTLTLEAMVFKSLWKLRSLEAIWRTKATYHVNVMSIHTPKNGIKLYIICENTSESKWKSLEVVKATELNARMIIERALLNKFRAEKIAMRYWGKYN